MELFTSSAPMFLLKGDDFAGNASKGDCFGKLITPAEELLLP